MRPTIECDGVTGIGTEYRDSPEEEVIYYLEKIIVEWKSKRNQNFKVKDLSGMCASREGFCMQRDKTHR